MRVRPFDIINHPGTRVSLCLSWLFILISGPLFAFQNSKVDSLRTVLNSEIADSARVDTYNALAYHTYRILPDTAKLYAARAMDLSNSIQYLKGKAASHNSFGFIAFSSGAYDEALLHYQQFREISAGIGDSVSLANALNNLGILYRNQGRLNEALLSYEQSLAIRHAIGSDTGLGPMYNNLGLLNTDLGNYKEAMDFYLKAIDAKRKPDRMTGRAMAYINLASLKDMLDDYEGSCIAFEKAYSIYQEYNDQKGMAISFHNLAKSYKKQGETTKALTYYLKSVKINSGLNNRKQLAENLEAISQLKYEVAEWDSCAFYLKQAQTIANGLQALQVAAKIKLGFGKLHHVLGDQRLALQSTKQAYDDFMTIGAKKDISASALLLSKIYDQVRNHSKAYDFLKIHLNYSDSLMNENKVAEIAKIEFNYDLAKVESEKQRLLEEQEELGFALSVNQKQLAHQRQTILWGGVVLALVVVSSIFIWHFYQQAKKTRNSLKEANLEISRFNQSLEQKIHERTEKIEKQNQQLMDYAFAISHEIRSPLTNLIGFLDLDDKDEVNDFSEEEKRQIKNSMANSIQKIDEATRKAARIGNPGGHNLPKAN